MQTRMEQFPATNPNPVLSAGKDGIVLYSNVAGEPLLHEWGVNIGEKLPLHIENIVHRVISLNSPEKMEVKAGNRIYLVSFHSIPKEECVNVYGFDISDQKKLEVKLRESEDRFYKAFHGNPTALTITCVADNRYVDVNDSYLHLLEYNSEDVIGRTTKELDLFPNFAEREETVALTLEQGYVHNHEMDVRTKTGRILRVLFSLETVNINQERHILATFIDITERKQAEERLRYHANLVDNVSDAIISTDKELKIRSWNKAAERIYGWQEDEVIDQKGPDILQTTFPEGLSREAIAKDIFEKGYWEGELIQKTKDGRNITVYAKSMVLKDESGVVIGGVSISSDITERKRTKETLHEAYETLQVQSEELQVSNEELQSQS